MLFRSLFIRQFIKVPFRLLFNGHDFDPKKPDLAKVEFQINTIDLRQPSEFIKIGGFVTNTKFRWMPSTRRKTRSNIHRNGPRPTRRTTRPLLPKSAAPSSFPIPMSSGRETFR